MEISPSRFSRLQVPACYKTQILINEQMFSVFILVFGFMAHILFFPFLWPNINSQKVTPEKWISTEK